MLIRIWLLVASLGVVATTYAQTTLGTSGSLPGEQRLIPPSPTTAGLGTYGALPVDLNAGVVSVSIPLGEVRCRSLSIPIALSYRTTGVRVEEVASWAGLGWDLNPGGLITRTVRGQADDNPTNGYYATYPQWRAADSLYRANPTPATQAAKTQADQNAANGLIDTELDTYTLSLPGYSATFLFDSQHQLHLNPAKNWLLSGSPTGVWEAISPDGIRYAFEAIENTQPVDNSGNGNAPIVFYSAWHLTSITSADGKDKIFFDYIPNQNGFAQAVPLSKVSRAKLYPFPYSPQNDSPGYCALDQEFNNGNVITAINYSTLSLLRISTATTTVTFTSDANRPDLSPVADAPGRRLTAVTFTDVRNPAVSRRFTFTYAPLSGVYDRLQLNALQQVGQPAYTFHYNDATLLPLRTSNAQDHWGFYNGRANCSLIPAPPASVASNRLADPSACADRTTNPYVMQAGVLTSVKYPTGGQTYFTYEANTVAEPGAVDNTQTNFTAVASGLLGDTSPSQLDPVSQAVYDQMFVPNTWPGEPSVGAQVVPLPLGADNVSFSPPYYHQGTATSFQTFYEMWKLNDTNLDPATYQSGTKIYPPSGFPAIAPTTLPPGTYLLLAATTEQSDGATLEVKMHVKTAKSIFTRAVGGLRIRRMVDYTRLGDSLVSEYDYTRYDSTAQQRVSSGRLFFDPQYIRFTACAAAIIAASDTRTMSFAQEGYHIGYDQVSVTRHGSANGKTTYTYLNGLSANSRNLVAEETERDGAGRLLKRITKAYYNELTRPVPLTKVVFSRNIVGYNNCGPQASICIPFYVVLREIYETLLDSYQGYQEPLLQSVSEQLFAAPVSGSSATLSRQSNQSYSYLRLPDGQRFGSPSWVRQSLTNGEHLATHTTYAREYLAANPADMPTTGLAELAAHHVQTAVVETQQWRHRNADSTLVSGALTHYQALQPRRSWRLETATPIGARAFTAARVQNQQFVHDARYVETVSYDRYDRWGNVAQEHYHATMGSYLWDDQGTRLLARVRQARYTQIGYTSFEPTGSGRWVYDTTAVRAGGVTGRQCYVWGNTAVALDSLPPGTYSLTLWATSAPTLLLNSSGVPTPAPYMTGLTQANGTFKGYKYSLLLTAPLNKVAITGPVGQLLDEIRCYPSGTLMQSYTEEPLNGLTSQTGPDGRTLTYEYDTLGRLIRTRDEQGRILSQQQYHYAQP